MPNIIPVPIPDRVAVLIGSTIPKHVLDAEVAAEEAALAVRLFRSPRNREARELALADLARANKTLAAWNPKLVLRPRGGA